MDFLRYFIIFILISSCAKIGYVAKQFPEQMFLLYGSRDNEEILKDPTIPKMYKDKIVLIQKYKSYFFKYFSKEKGEIYSETTILDRKAVSYLVIASKYNQIKPKEECFPFVGCFPYLGFFDEGDAIDHAKQLEKEDYQTWVRPVYAYSSLNYFTDPILSSFFNYSDIELAELIFHELFHTIFFIKDEVDLNENLANFVAKKMVFEYFKMNKKQIGEIEKERSDQQALTEVIVSSANRLKEIYSESNSKNKKDYKDLLENYINQTFIRSIKQSCRTLGIDEKECYPLRRKWNNASFAAFLTYEKEGNLLGEYYKKMNLSLKDFYTHLEKKYKDYKDKDVKGTFRDYLFKS